MKHELIIFLGLTLSIYAQEVTLKGSRDGKAIQTQVERTLSRDLDLNASVRLREQMKSGRIGQADEIVVTLPDGKVIRYFLFKSPLPAFKEGKWAYVAEEKGQRSVRVAGIIPAGSRLTFVRRSHGDISMPLQ